MNSKFEMFSLIIEEYDELNGKHITKDDLKNYLDQNTDTISFYAFILHDKDKNACGVEERKHYHIVIETFNKYAKSTIISWFASDLFINKNCVGVKGILESQMVGYIRYLTHLDEDDTKYKYEDLEVASNDLETYYKAVERNTFDKVFNIEYLVNLILDDSTTKKTDVYLALGLKASKSYGYLIESLWKDLRDNYVEKKGGTK